MKKKGRWWREEEKQARREMRKLMGLFSPTFQHSFPFSSNSLPLSFSLSFSPLKKLMNPLKQHLAAQTLSYLICINLHFVLHNTTYSTSCAADITNFVLSCASSSSLCYVLRDARGHWEILKEENAWRACKRSRPASSFTSSYHHVIKLKLTLFTILFKLLQANM